MLQFLATVAIAAGPPSASPPRLDVGAIDRERILTAANAALRHEPVTVTSASSPRSAGRLHDYFSEADYWWPDPANPGGPYIQRDGLSNPDNFDEHRKAMRRLSVDVPALVAAWKLTGEARYAEHAVRHLRAWFVDDATRMSPHLRWTTDKNGIEERDAKNTHASCWALQAAAFARLAGNDEVLRYCRDRFKTVLLPSQMAADGSFPEELRRTKPYGYSLFNLEALAGIAQLLSTPRGRVADPAAPRGRVPDPPAPQLKERAKDSLPSERKTARAGETVVVASPSRKVEIVVGVIDGGLTYRVTLAGQPVIEASPLGILMDGVDLGRDARVGRVDRWSTNERYPWRGVHSEAVDRSRGARIHLTHAKAPEALVVELRAFDDAAAFRLVVPGRGPRVPDAASAFRLPTGSTVWYHGARDHYEGIHQRKELAEVTQGDWAAPPLTFRLPDGRGYASITEAALRGYAGMMLQADGKGGFQERLGHAVPASYPYTLRYGEDNAKRLAAPAAIEGTVTTPWRVILVGKDLDALVGSDAIHDLAPPPDPKLFPQGIRTPWLHPGRAVWRYLDGGGDCDNVPPGAERDQCLFPVIKEFSRLAGELGFEHQVVEGTWRRWSDDQLKELVAYSRERGVSIWLWIHSKDQHDAAERRRLFERLHALGIAGIKVDFFDHEAKEVVDLYEAILKDAAETQLLVDFHGANKPTGMERTWPNEMTREGVRGLEYRSTPGWAVHNTTIPFTRFLAGAADYTPVVFGDRRKDTTWAHQIATAVVFTSPVLVYGGHPKSLLDNPAADVIESIPSVWDETRVLPPSAIGELAVYARRRGERWFLGVLNGKEPRTLRVPVSFLGKGRYHATLVGDDRTNGAAVQLGEREVTANDFVDVALRGGGGFVGRFAHQAGGALRPPQDPH